MNHDELLKHMAVPIRKRRGRFKMADEIVDSDPLSLLPIFARCIVVHCEHLFHERAFEYVAYSYDFDEVEDGEKIPEYQWTITKSGPALVSVHAERLFDGR